MDPLVVANRTFDFEVGSLGFAPTYWQAIAIVFLLFLLLWTLARLRRMLVGWSLGKSAYSMLFWGFLLTLILEGFLLIGGRTLLTEILGWKSAPKPILNALDVGRDKLVNVLGITDEIEATVAKENPTAADAVKLYQSLPPEEAEKFQTMICEP